MSLSIYILKIYFLIDLYVLFGMMVRVFANSPGDRGSIPGRVIPKTQKWSLMPPYLTLSNIRYGSRVKWNNPRNGVAPFPTPWCSSYRKGSLRVTLDYGRELYFFYLDSLRIAKSFTLCWYKIKQRILKE